MMEYKGYIGQVEFDDEASIFHGRVINTRDVITFYGKSVAELRKEFRKSVDVYLDFCAERGEEPDKPFSGQFVTRVSPELHQSAALAAARAGKSLNAWVAEQLQNAIQSMNLTSNRRSLISTGRDKRYVKSDSIGREKRIGKEARRLM